MLRRTSRSNSDSAMPGDWKVELKELRVLGPGHNAGRANRLFLIQARDFSLSLFAPGGFNNVPNPARFVTAS